MWKLAAGTSPNNTVWTFSRSIPLMTTVVPPDCGPDAGRTDSGRGTNPAVDAGWVLGMD
jgi:hypothetical protein